MLALTAMLGVVIVWLRYFAPDALDERLRRGLLWAAGAVFVFSLFVSVAQINGLNAARQEIRTQYLRSKREKREAVEQNRDGDPLILPSR